MSLTIGHEVRAFLKLKGATKFTVLRKHFSEEDPKLLYKLLCSLVEIGLIKMNEDREYTISSGEPELKEPDKMYIAGKITGLDLNEARAKFKAAERVVKDLGYLAVNPMTLPHEHDKTWEAYLAECLAALSECRAILMLPDWVESQGAKLEHAYAENKNLMICYL